ncbi:MAG: protease modulator HflC [Pseudomonadota bacterium]|nr:protease modulator HflC [Pseudomonadota bacterium]
MAPVKTIIGIVGVILIVLFFSCVYTVDEGERALLLRLGQIDTDAKGAAVIEKPGLHFKIPFINSVRYFDVRLRTKDAKSSRILTAEQRYVLVDYYVKWRIDDLALFFKRTGGFSERGERFLEQKINNSLRAAFGKLPLKEVISGKRLNVMTDLKASANASAKSLGITVIDVRIKRIDLPAQVSASVFQRMRTDRFKVATEHRSDGQSEATAIRARADSFVIVTLANARNEAAQKRALGRGAAAKIYADAYSQNASFYSMLRSLEAYQHTFNNKNDLMILQPDTQFFKYFNGVNTSTTSAKQAS